MDSMVYLATSNTIPVYDECDILVVGGGSAGHSAAIAAACVGAKNIILLERYGYMGGDATGGYVIMVPKLSWYDKSFVRGIQEEWFSRMITVPDAVLGPKLSEVGNIDSALVNAWKAIHGCVSESEPQRLVRAVYFEPNQLKIEMDKMLLEERNRIRVLYHSWGTKPIMVDGCVKGVIFESKEGRQIEKTLERPLATLNSSMPFDGYKNLILRTSQQDLVRKVVAAGTACAVLPQDMVEDWDGIVFIPFMPSRPFCQTRMEQISAA